VVAPSPAVHPGGYPHPMTTSEPFVPDAGDGQQHPAAADPGAGAPEPAAGTGVTDEEPDTASGPDGDDEAPDAARGPAAPTDTPFRTPVPPTD
jgi:hypothetical protein